MNVLNLYLDYYLWKQQSKVLLLPQSILKKNAISPQSAKNKVIHHSQVNNGQLNDLTDGTQLSDYSSIIMLHEDKFSKKEYSIIIVHNLQCLSGSSPNPNDKAYAIVIKDNGTVLSDSEIDALIGVRKLLSNILGKQINNENLPSKLIKLQPVIEERLQKSQLVNCMFGIKAFQEEVEMCQGSIESLSIIEYSFDLQNIDDLQNEIRDLLYFLYDFKFFESYDIFNESSLIAIKRVSLNKSIDNKSDSDSTSSNKLEELDESYQQYKDQSDIMEEIIEEEEEAGIGNDRQQNKDLFTIIEENESYMISNTSQNFSSNQRLREVDKVFEILDEDNQLILSSDQILLNESLSSESEKVQQQLQYEPFLTGKVEKSKEITILNQQLQPQFKRLPQAVSISLNIIKPKQMIKPESINKKIGNEYEFKVEALEFNLPQVIESKIYNREAQVQIYNSQNIKKEGEKRDRIRQKKLHSLFINHHEPDSTLFDVKLEQQNEKDHKMHSGQKLKSDKSTNQLSTNQTVNTQNNNRYIFSAEKPHNYHERMVIQAEGDEYTHHQLSMIDSSQMVSSFCNMSTSHIEKENIIDQEQHQQQCLMKSPSPPQFILNIHSPQMDKSPLKESFSPNSEMQIIMSPQLKMNGKCRSKENIQTDVKPQLDRKINAITLDLSAIKKNLQQENTTDRMLSSRRDDGKPLDSERRGKILELIKRGKFQFKTNKKPLQSGRIRYKALSTNAKSYDMPLQSKALNEKNNDNILDVSCKSNTNCRLCQGTNWNQKHNMPCSECVQLPSLQDCKKYKRDLPRQIEVLDQK